VRKRPAAAAEALPEGCTVEWKTRRTGAQVGVQYPIYTASDGTKLTSLKALREYEDL
jgi:hypothetical protein